MVVAYCGSCLIWRGCLLWQVLLLGSSKHVMLTPMCAYSVDSAGLRGGALTAVECLTSDGLMGLKLRTVGSLPHPVRHRLYLTWGHGESDYQEEVGQWRRPLSELIDAAARESLGSRLRRQLQAFTGKVRVSEHWGRYPSAPFDPRYYTQLLSAASNMSDEEERARAVMEARPSGAAADADAVRIEMDPAKGAGGSLRA